MRYEAELQLLRDTFEKCRIRTVLLDPEMQVAAYPELGLHIMLSGQVAEADALSKYLPPIAAATIYQLTTPLNCTYLYFRLPETSQSILMIGPYLTASPSAQEIMEWGESHAVEPGQQKEMLTYLQHVPVLSEGNHLLALLDAFAERVWGAGGFVMEDLQRTAAQDVPHFWAAKSASRDENPMLQMHLIEDRYTFENKLIDAVSQGQFHKAEMLLANVAQEPFEQRLADPVRNIKNYCIITNTLFRKAAEKGGVHPFYLDSVSSDFAIRIEQITTVDAGKYLILDMLRNYCRLVRKHSMKGYSAPVQKAITCIDGDLSANLSLQSLATRLSVSGSYLSSLFRKETGQTLTDFISQRRIHHAMYLLETTHLQVQTIAQHCGFLDVHYFTKVFKKITGTTPRQYRQSAQK